MPDNERGLLAEIAQDPQLHIQNLQLLFGDLLNRSPYDQYATLLQTTPESMHPFGPRAEAARGMALLMIKAIAITPNPETGMFSFEFPNKRGFQIGDPRRTSRVGLEVFGLGEHHLEIFLGTRNDGIRLSQPEVNRVLTSLRTAPAEVQPTALTSLPK